MSKLFTRNNTYRHVDVLDKFLVGYKNTVHSKTGMAPSFVSDKNVLRIWERTRKRQAKIKRVRGPPIYYVGQR